MKVSTAFTVAGALVLLPPGPLSGQSLTAATLIGLASDSLGRPVFDADVTVLDQGSGLARHTQTSRSGEFRIGLLPTGGYDVLIESIGYRPKRVRNIPLVPGAEVTLKVQLDLAPPPVDRVDTVFFAGSALGGRGSGMGARLSPVVAGEFADRYQDARELLRHATDVTQGGARGAPATGQLLVIDGVPFRPARNPALGPGFDLLTVPVVGLDRAEASGSPGDVEFPGSAGGFLLADTRRGSNTLAFKTSGDWAGNPLGGSKFFDPGAVSHSSFRGSGVVSGPIIRDTAVFVVGVAARRDETPLPPVAVVDSATTAVLRVAQDSFGQDLGAYRRTRVSRETAVSGFGRLDWNFTGTSALMARLVVGSTKGDSPLLGPARLPSLGSGVTGMDVDGVAAFSSSISGRVAQEFRVGVGRSRREWTNGTLPPTLVVNPALPLGSDPVLAGTFSRTDLRVSDALHVDLGRNALKLNVEGTLASIDNTPAYDRSGSFVFGDATLLAQRRGFFTQTVGPTPVVTFSVPRAALALQDAWSVVPGLTLTLGVRAEYERLPTDRITRSDSLLLLTGLDNTNLQASRVTVSPRLGFSWDAGQRGSWVLRGSVGTYTEAADPALLGTLITYSGRQRTRSGLGILSAWPMVPDSTQAPVRGPDVVLADRSLASPQTRAVALLISRALGTSTAFHVAGSYRHMDFLVRRRDLNLLPAPTSTDSRGRPMYAILQQLGGQLTAVPGSNRRFPAFDHIWALDQDGFSDYWGLTMALERESPTGVRLLLSYTYSQATDNWLSASGGIADAQIAPFPTAGFPGFPNGDWSEGPADLDVPHNASVGVVIPLSPVRWGARLGVLYQYRSGYPFTPGFRNGVDVNGDGSSVNDPAYVDEGISGTSDLYGAWDCLRRQAGLFAGRNSCRAPGVEALDLRLSVAAVHAPGFRAELVLDALNLMDSADAVVDRALYLVDPTGAVSTSSTTGVVTIPLRTNPGFGQPLYRLTSGRSFRFGVRVTY